MNPDNFNFEIYGWSVFMTNGELEINGVSYEDDSESPIYPFVRWMAKAMGLI